MVGPGRDNKDATISESWGASPDSKPTLFMLALDEIGERELMVDCFDDGIAAFVSTSPSYVGLSTPLLSPSVSTVAATWARRLVAEMGPLWPARPGNGFTR
jgi:hypothetical protein